MTIELIHADCLDVDWPQVDLVLADPPYGIDYQSARRTDRTKWKPKIINDKKPFIAWIEKAYKSTNEGGAIICFCRWDVEEVFKQELERVGYKIKSQIIWDKVIHGMGDLRGSFAPQHENAWFAVKGRFKFWNKRPHTIIKENRVDAQKMTHPNEKPIGLYEKIIIPVVRAGGSVIDPFFGSCNSGQACINTGRNFIGIEKDEKYYNIAKERLGL